MNIFNDLFAEVLVEKMLRVPFSIINPIRQYVEDVYKKFYIAAYRHIPSKNYDSFLAPTFDKTFTITIDSKPTPKIIKITVGFYYDSKGSDAGFYSDSKQKMYINVQAPINYLLNQTVEHEILHHIQRIFYKTYAGLPKRKLRNIEYTPSGFKKGQERGTIKRLPHVLRDVEYYPNLNSAYHLIAQELSDPVIQRYTKDPIKFNLFIKTKILNMDMLKKLRKHDPAKWQNAVKLLYRALTEEPHEVYSNVEHGGKKPKNPKIKKEYTMPSIAATEADFKNDYIPLKLSSMQFEYLYDITMSLEDNEDFQEMLLSKKIGRPYIVNEPKKKISLLNNINILPYIIDELSDHEYWLEADMDYPVITNFTSRFKLSLVQQIENWLGKNIRHLV